MLPMNLFFGGYFCSMRPPTVPAYGNPKHLDCTYTVVITCAVCTLQGLDFVHRSPFGFHGELKDTCCLIDKRFTLKISRLGLACLRKKLHAERSRVGIWCPPELVDKVVVGNKYGDLYCAALIVYEIIALLPPKKDLVCSPAAGESRSPTQRE